MRILLTVFMFLFVTSAWALPIPTEYIGHAYDDGWGYPATSSYVGPANRGGTFIGFRISQPYRVSIISGILRGAGEWERGSISMSLIRGSRNFRDTALLIPTNDIIFETERFTFPLDNQQQTVSHNASLDLEAGDYWVKYQGAAMYGHVIAQGFGIDGDVIESERMAGVHAPEPTTLLLMAGGILGAIRMRRKV